MKRQWRKRRKVEASLQSLIEILIDSQDGLVTIGQKLKDATIRRYFFAESLKRAQFIEELRDLFDQLELGKPRNSGSNVGALHRTWARFKLRLGGSDSELLVTAERGELAIVQLYDKVIRSTLPECIYEILMSQAKHIRMAYSYIKLSREGNLVRNSRYPKFRPTGT